jgi:hypothetical protein
MNSSTTALRLMIDLAHGDEERLLVDATLTINGGHALETDLFEGPREPACHVGVAA